MKSVVNVSNMNSRSGGDILAARKKTLNVVGIKKKSTTQGSALAWVLPLGAASDGTVQIARYNYVGVWSVGSTEKGKVHIK